MTRVARLGVGFVLLLAVVWSAGQAQAQQAFTRGRFSLHADVGYGFAVEGDSLRSPYDALIAAHGGYTFDMGLHLGAMADYFIGDTQYVAGTNRDSLEWNYDWSHMAAEVGYDFALNKLVLRPTLAAGAAVRGSCLDNVCYSDAFLLVAPSITALAPLGEHSFFTFAVRYFLVPGGDSDPFDGVAFAAGLGAAF